MAETALGRSLSSPRNPLVTTPLTSSPPFQHTHTNKYQSLYPSPYPHNHNRHQCSLHPLATQSLLYHKHPSPASTRPQDSPNSFSHQISLDGTTHLNQRNSTAAIFPSNLFPTGNIHLPPSNQFNNSLHMRSTRQATARPTRGTTIVRLHIRSN